MTRDPALFCKRCEINFDGPRTPTFILASIVERGTSDGPIEAICEPCVTPNEQIRVNKFFVDNNCETCTLDPRK